MRLPSLTSALLFLLAPAIVPAADWNVRDHVPLEDFVIQSHRGAGNLAPENSRETFELAWSLGTIPEADLRTTKDGVIVAFHDPDFARILPAASAETKKKGIEDLTWSEVAELDIGAWKGAEFAGQRVPRIDAMFAQMKEKPGRRVYVDIKNVDLGQLARLAKEAGVADRLILASTDHAVIRKWKDLAPESKTLHWMGGDEAVLSQRIAKLEAVEFAGVDQLQIHVKPAADGFTPSAAFLRQTGARLRAHGILFQALPWQSRDKALFVRLMDLGVASFATDFPDFAAATVRDYYGRR
ncbi:glycerophosphodiester phosphodiesterase [Luteolibacter marinus]|uniref:glycerophosphodiester phosphodiesterase n=1 Tax=Luteolibacter marinus TaxID=2776705 RepID=UPI001867041B|nr:glycerophosphodiester phosphodiesterase family protein [Luteolibacter marinus]